MKTKSNEVILKVNAAEPKNCGHAQYTEILKSMERTLTDQLSRQPLDALKSDLVSLVEIRGDSKLHDLLISQGISLLVDQLVYKTAPHGCE
jgi:hypothetical protein